MRKFLTLVLLAVVVVSSLGATAASTTQHCAKVAPRTVAPASYTDELDQSMTDYDGYLPLGYANLGTYVNLSIAQSFVPQKDVLTRAQFLMGRNASTVRPCVLAVRSNLTGPNLAEVSVDPSKFPLINGTPTEENLSWVNFDFNDIWVTKGQTYYLVVYTTYLVNNYYWVSGNGTNVYQNGTVYLSVDNGTTWSEFQNADGCFKTYGLQETFLSITPGGGFGAATFTIKNIGNVTAWDVQVNMSVTGGIFGLIKYHHLSTIDELAPQGEEQVKTAFLFGLGPIALSVSVQAANVRPVSVEKTGKILLFFIMI